LADQIVITTQRVEATVVELDEILPRDGGVRRVLEFVGQTPKLRGR
jgi:hypothetical protein